jgi:t-SNARE complex subunit (syntaxin)
MEYISFLVKQQGEMIDNIHDNIVNAKDYIEKAEKVLEKKK